MNLKKGVLIISSIYVVSLLIFIFWGGDCYDSLWCQENILDRLTPVLQAFLPLVFVFLLSIFTYRMHDRVFRAWWNFARFMVPIIIVATLWLNKVDSGSGLGSGIFTIWVLFTLYAIFIITSLWKIVSAYDITKKK